VERDCFLVHRKPSSLPHLEGEWELSDISFIKTQILPLVVGLIKIPSHLPTPNPVTLILKLNIWI
jgi:hypothetical protein